MASDFQIERIQRILAAKGIPFTEKRMFGGISLLVDDKFLIAHSKKGMLVRIDPDESEALVKLPGAGLMLHGGKPQLGYLYVQEEGFDAEEDLGFWVAKALEFNPKAKASKK